MPIYGTLAPGLATPSAEDTTSGAGTGALILPKGNTAQRPGSPSTGMMRFNTDTSNVEMWNGSRWLSGGLGNVLFYNDGSTLSGWTVSNASVTSGTGNPGYSILTPGSNGDYAYISPPGISSLLNTTIQWDCNTTELCDFFFGCNSSGVGNGVRVGINTGWAVGFQTTSSWTSWSATTGSYSVSPGSWNTIKLQITSGSVATIYLNGTQVASQTVTLNGTYIGLVGDGGGGNTYWDNIYIYPGIV
jgi:hypothetical protein